MASNRKKQDEKHLKILRNLVSLPANKQCFDCNQRGPTYVNTTIGSFVCTTCSGLLRGLTPPHRVKSISMATFTPEEIESLKSRGNEYCRKVWLALYDSNHIQDTKDEQHVKDFMVAKYEKKRYYMEPSAALKNGSSHSPTPLPSSVSDNFNKIQRSAVSSSSLTSPPPVSIAPPIPQTPPMNTFTTSVSAFNLSDPFGPVNNIQHHRQQTHSHPHPHPQSQQQQQQHQQHHQPQPAPAPQLSFANFDNNPIFNSTPVVTNTMTTSASFPSSIKPKPPAEDKYAALKDLDCLMKMQHETQNPTPTQTPAPTQPVQANGWLSSSNGTEGGNNFFNPFQTDNIKTNNVHNPFRSGFAQQIDNNISSSNCNNGNNSNNCNPWGSTNPWGTTASPSIPTSHSMPFPSTSWNGNLTAIPGNSSNPFL